MGLSICTNQTDFHDKELTQHGDPAFPIACYADDLAVREVPWHWHEEWEYIIAHEGSAEVLFEQKRIMIPEGDGVFINTAALHAVRPVPGSASRLHSAVFHPRLIGGNTDSVFWQKLVHPVHTNEHIHYRLLHQNVEHEKNILVLLEEAWRAIVSEPEDFQNLARYQLSKAIGLLVEDLDTGSKFSESERLNAVRIRTMMEYIDLHYGEDLTVQKIAGSAAVSTSVCLRCFHSSIQTTPMQYLKQLRLRKAANMLMTTNKTAKETGLDCGFSDISYFTKSFREMYGCTPGSYRKQ